jgi:hypothetical protein
MSNLKLWQRLAVDRALVASLAEMEVEEARIIGDPERITIADRYHNQAVRLLATAQRKLSEFAGVPA